MNARPAGPLRILAEAAVIGVVFAALLGLSAYLVYQKSLQTLEDEIKLGLLSQVRSAATTVDGDMHETFSAAIAPDDPNYLRIGGELERIRQNSQDIRYIYTTVMRDGEVRFLVNLSPQNDMDNDGRPDAAPALLAKYEDAPPELVKALTDFQPAVSAEPYSDEWGSFTSAYAPILRADGRPVGVLAMDLEMSSFYRRLLPIHELFRKALFVIAFLSLCAGLLVYGLRTSSVRRLRGLQAWRQIAETLEQQAETDQLRQLQDRTAPWTMLFGAVATDRVSPSADDLEATHLPFETYRLGPWLTDNHDLLRPTPHCRIAHTLPVDCTIHAQAALWSRFWAATLALWHDCVQAPVTAEFVVIDELLDTWQLGCRITALPAGIEPAGHLPPADFWARFLAWQARAAALGVTIHRVDQGSIELHFAMAKFAQVDERAAA